MMQCRVCRNALDVLAEFDRVPKDVQHLTVTDSSHITTTDMMIYQCVGCGLVQTDMQLNQNYYDDYLMSQTFSPQLSDYLTDLVAHFVDKFNITPQHQVLDIGCGDGAFMLPFVNRGITCHGLEPSQRSGEMARQRGLDVTVGYMTADTRLPSAPYDAFVSRQVLEHVDDVSGLLQGIRLNCKAGAVGIVEVPRLEKALQDLRFYDFFPDHVNYFTVDTLRSTLELNGFEVLDVFAAMYDEYNVALVKIRNTHDFSHLESNRQRLTKQIQDLVAQPAQCVAMWGAGAKGLSLLSAMGEPWIDVLVDSDVNKISRWVPGTRLQIQDPDSIMQLPVTAVVISAMAYKHMILPKLRHMGFAGKIYVIGSQGLECVA